MSSDLTKKRKTPVAEIGGVKGDNTAAATAGSDDIIAEMKANMTRMQNEMDSMKGRLLQMDELERRRYQSQEEKYHVQEEKSKLQEEKCKMLEDRCESLERSMKILIDEQKWEYSAPDIPRSHWIESGFDEDYIEDIEQFLKDIKRDAFYLRNMGASNTDIDLGENEGSTLILHDDMLLPHWREFANAVQLYNHPIEMVRMESVQLTLSVMNLLVPALKQKQFDYFYLGNNEFVNVREGIDFAVEIIKGNRQLKTFGWVVDRVNSMDDAQHLVGALIRHPSIDWISLKNCFGEDVNGFDILCSLLASGKSFNLIDFDNNNIQTVWQIMI